VASSSHCSTSMRAFSTYSSCMVMLAATIRDLKCSSSCRIHAAERHQIGTTIHWFHALIALSILSQCASCSLAPLSGLLVYSSFYFEEFFSSLSSFSSAGALFFCTLPWSWSFRFCLRFVCEVVCFFVFRFQIWRSRIVITV
jgi:hypothetical protein